MSECARALFWGDVVADDDYTAEFDDGATQFTLTFNKGSWFPSPYAFWLYVQENSDFGHFLDYFGEDANGDHYIVFLAPITVTWTGSGNMPAEVGAASLSAANQTEAWPYCWNTTFPPSIYTRSVAVRGGTSQRGQDGTAYTVVGVPHEKRKLAVILDRRSGAYEASKWLNLHRNLLRRGRSVAFYMESIVGDGAGAPGWGYLGTMGWTYGDLGLGRFESLVLPTSGVVSWRPSRLIESKEALDIEDGMEFYVRQPVPLSDPTTNIGRLT